MCLRWIINTTFHLIGRLYHVLIIDVLNDLIIHYLIVVSVSILKFGDLHRPDANIFGDYCCYEFYGHSSESHNSS